MSVVGRSWLIPFIAIAMLGGSVEVRAVQPGEVLDDPVLESRARSLSGELRCLVCQNQSIDDSDAPLAKDLRLLVRERLKAGDSDGVVREFLVARYGQFVLLKPMLGPGTLLLWFGPFFALSAGGLMVLLARRRARVASDAPSELSPAESAALARLLHGDEAGGRPTAS